MTTGAAAAIPVFFLPQPDDPLLTFLIHLTLIIAFSLGLVFHLAPLVDEAWFGGLEMGEQGRRALTWIVAMTAVSGAAGGVSLATGAAIRYAPSLQFLLSLSALGITWVVAAAVLGARRRFGATAAVAVGLAMAAIAVGSLWRYFDDVGFSDGGGWLLDGAALLRLAVLAWVALAVAAVTLLSMGIRSSGDASDSLRTR
jgi:hypothetical protein